MTIRTRRRGRRSLAAILAAMLMASVLAVVAGSPAQAANTSSEVLTEDGEREFGGRDRYATALALAENFGRAKGLGNVPTAFVASGYKLVDAVSVSGLAGFLDAPVLLTPSDSLDGRVADFIEDYGVQTVYILGGAGAVADSVLEDMEALANEPTVSRIEGADRYETAANAASKLGGGAAWCGAEAPAALLANGGDVSLVEAMMVGPIAHRLQLPLLLTAADSLPTATADFIEAEDIEHVVIVGGTDSVSDDVATALSEAGVDTVDRVAGDSPAGTSVALTELAFNGCAEDLIPVSGNTVALVSQDGLPDGVAAAPVLTSTFAGGDLVPILVVGDTLPASVSDYLAATPSEDSDGDKVNLRIVAVGGNAAVSQSVMDAALAAAASADDLTVSIGSGGLVADTDRNGDTNDDSEIDAEDGLAVGDDRIILYFSDDVIAEDAALEGKIRDAIEVNGAPARLASADEVQHTGADDACNPDQVAVTLASPLKAGDTVSVVGGFKLGATGDQRTVGGASATVPAPTPDRTRPTISIIMIAGRDPGVAEVTISEPDGAVLSTDDITVTRRGTGATADAVVSSVDGTSGTISFDRPLVPGDRITVASGAAEDTAGNKSLQRSFTAISPHKSPRITSVSMSNLKHSTQGTIAVDTEISGADNAITITAKADGAAAGAFGNGWAFVYDVASTWTNDAEAAVDIDVRVNSRDRVVSVRFNTGNAKNGDLKAALEGNSAFDAMFEVKLPADAAAGCGATSNIALAIGNDDRQVTTDGGVTGGMTQVAIEVRFNGYVNTVSDDELLDDILADVVKRTEAADDTAARTALGLDSPTATTGPTTMVRYEAITGQANQLPQVRDLVTTLAGHDGAAEITGPPLVPAIDAVTAVAIGFAPDGNAPGRTDNDTAHDKVDEDQNAASQVRIGRSSSVKVPATPTS